MKKNHSLLVNFFSAFVLPISFQNRVSIKTDPINESTVITIKDLRADENIYELVQSIQSQVTTPLQIKTVSPDKMELSTQDREPIK